MIDPRVQKLAHVLVNYSLALKPGNKFVINAPVAAEPLVREVYREAIRAGAHVYTRLTLDGMAEILYKEANDDQLNYVSELRRFEVEHFDAMLGVFAEVNTKSQSGLDPSRMAMTSRAQRPFQQRFFDRAAQGQTQWCATLFPTHAHAQDANMSLSDYEDFVFNAGLLNEPDPIAAWQKIRESQQRIVDFLNSKHEIRIVAPGTDIRYKVGGRRWINCYGDRNFPDGEVFTGPVEDSAQGVVTYSYPAVYRGNSVENVVIRFEDGKAVEATAGRGQDFLLSMLNMDAGARYLGEVAFGTNYGITRFTGHTLFDEKIGGTMHMALGASYPETGGVNQSGLHWDMVCNLQDGEAYADGELFYRGGKFLI